jgi:hypothetical protein
MNQTNRVQTSTHEYEFSSLLPALTFREHHPWSNAYIRWADVRRGVYLIYYDYELDYVGRSSDSIYGIAWRVCQHFSEALMLRHLDRYSVSLLATPPDEDEHDIEKHLRQELKPLCNGDNDRFNLLYGPKTGIAPASAVYLPDLGVTKLVQPQP